MNAPPSFTAFRIHQDAGGHHAGPETMTLDRLSPGEVVIRAHWSSVNYKDALAATGRGKVLRRSPLNGGIDVAGTVVSSSDDRVAEGSPVLATGCGLGESRDGGWSQFVRLPADATIPLPAGLSLREAMVIGTAGYTAALALHRLLENHQQPDLGPLVVTGATGGVGMLAVDVFSQAGFDVIAVSGKPERAAFLQMLGAREVVGRERLSIQRPLASACFGGGLDNVGGPMLASLLAQTARGGNVASAGLAASASLEMTVMPFILRGVSLLGINASGGARALRQRIWANLAGAWRPRHLAQICTREASLDELPQVFDTMLSGGSFGRTVVRID